jgi:hypothetical protein
MKNISIDGQYFIDKTKRKVFLRGVNLGGSSKVPKSPDGATYKKDGLKDHQAVSFIGRPFPIQEADEHFTRLRTWGFNFLRFLVTWEAIEHKGPGIYDSEYLDYLFEIIEKAGNYGFNLFIDPHEDVWSRFTGGDGAPGWTLEKVGFNLDLIHSSGAAIVHHYNGDSYPKMIWPTNNYKLAAATMWTLFFAGNDFAPEFKVDGIPIQEYLQSHYINSIKEVAKRLNQFPHVVGYDSLNEPSAGWIGIPDLRQLVGQLKLGEMPTPWESIISGNGFSQEVEVWKVGKIGLKKTGWRKINCEGERVWQTGKECIWKKQGVWTFDNKGEPVLINPYYFAQVNGNSVDFDHDYLKPFINRFASEIRTIDSEAIIFIEAEPESKSLEWEEADARNIVNSSHWYDGVTLITKNFNPIFSMDTESGKLVLGKKKVKEMFKKQLQSIKIDSREKLGNVPTIIGEFGVPFDLNNKYSYKSGDYSLQQMALDMYYQAIESLFLNTTIWNYTSDNDNLHGDQWNDEDLSIFSNDQRSNPADIYSGGRAIAAFVRPYVKLLAGKPNRQAFDLQHKEYILAFEHNDLEVTEIFVPNYHYSKGFHVEVSDGKWSHNPDTQTLVYEHSLDQNQHLLRILPK